MSEKFPHLRWYEVADRVGKATFRFYTDKSAGTGFLVMVGKAPNGYMAILATAWHVVQDAVTGTSLMIFDQHGKEVARSMGGNMGVLEIGDGLDSGIVVVTSKQEIFSQDLLLPLLPFDFMFRRGTEIGWMGYPGFVEPELCFFHGHVAGMIKETTIYLVDGVAINGVSGGPVFDDRCHLAGLVSAYLPNRLSDNITLPGVAWMVPINFIYKWIQVHLEPRDLYANPSS